MGQSTDQFTRHRRQRWLFGLVVLLGVVLRFTNLLHKPVWIDEAFSLFHLSGFTQAIASQHLVTGAVIQTPELLSYQAPHAATNLLMMLRNIGDTAPELPPLYFALLYGWSQLFGDGLVALRALSALFSLAALPAMYWLCRELFGRSHAAWYGVALMAISPFHLLVAQEIRPYSLWTLLLLVTTAFLVRAQRSSRWSDWLGFSLGLTAAFYTHVLTLLPAVAYGLATLLQVRGNRERLRQFGGAILVSALGFLPWLWYGFLRPIARPTPHVLAHTSRFGILQGIAQSVTRFFADFNLGMESPHWALALYALLILGVFVLIVKSFLSLWRRESWEVRSLLLSLAIVPILGLVGSDAMVNTSRTLFTRYYLPSMIAIEATIGYGLAARRSRPTPQITPPQITPPQTILCLWPRRWWILLLVGTLSCTWFVLSPNWWHKTRTVADACIQSRTAPTAEQPQATIVTDEFFMRSLGLVHQLDPTVQFRFYPIASQQAPTIDQPASYLYMPSQAFAQALGQRYDLKPVCAPELWSITPKS
jgi:uncharacterized membrane protein